MLKITDVEVIEELERPAIYFCRADASVLDLLVERGSEPVAELQDLLPLVFEMAGLDIVGPLRWSAKAGCRTCPCSPGFILPPDTGKSIHVEYQVVPDM